eukprot:CAMPEP_0172168438 /NCGR_PEP_ID=MMETSP1050-20130122/10144_1 /TAXON_ID=233186 /ORGANISM="Cryptomonas curvata, Strain CCAP979/52" /LENGTH=437 /DNA_ID=CAMNT_0012839373 /DNA_START=67 /DNA_END=1378 /DNA_ORIENTATION=-
MAAAFVATSAIRRGISHGGRSGRTYSSYSRPSEDNMEGPHICWIILFGAAGSALIISGSFYIYESFHDGRASIVQVYNEKVSDWATFDHDALKNTSFSFRILSPVPMNDTSPRPPPICINVTTTNGSWIGDNCSTCLEDSNCSASNCSFVPGNTTLQCKEAPPPDIIMVQQAVTDEMLRGGGGMPWTPFAPRTDNDTLDSEQTTGDLVAYDALRYTAVGMLPARRVGPDGWAGPDFHIQIRAHYAGMDALFAPQPVRLLKEEPVAANMKICRTNRDFYWRDNACYHRVALQRICIQVNFTEGEWRPGFDSSGINMGCRVSVKTLEPQPESIYSTTCPPLRDENGTYVNERTPTLNPTRDNVCDFSAVNITIRSSTDPLIQARILTKMTLNFGMTPEENMQQGLVLFLVGAVVLCPLGATFAAKHIVRMRARRQRRMD